MSFTARDLPLQMHYRFPLPIASSWWWGSSHDACDGVRLDTLGKACAARLDLLAVEPDVEWTGKVLLDRMTRRSTIAG